MKTIPSKRQALALLLASLIFLSSCVSSTVINSEPPGAKIYINDEFRGTTPYTYRDTKITGMTNFVRLEKEGYEPFITVFSRTEEADVGAIVAGVFLWIPFLWIMKYHPYRTYELFPAAQWAEDYAPVLKLTPYKTELLRELKRLADEGILTPEEYEREKQKVLGRDQE
jgi:transglutaminase-like putative cysteine protease